jgi:shikimate kinase
MHNRIYLIGFMGSGKSTAGKRLAGAMGYDFADLDSMIEQKYRITIPALFERYDEAAFRKVEQETLRNTFQLNRHVIATGGGTPCFFDNMELINSYGTSVYLQMGPQALYQRLMNAKKKRPLIRQHPPEKVLGYIKEMLEAREPFYLQGHYVVNGESLDISALCHMLQDH